MKARTTVSRIVPIVPTCPGLAAVEAEPSGWIQVGTYGSYGAARQGGSLRIVKDTWRSGCGDGRLSCGRPGPR
jgi:hypothetical protein